MHIIILNSKLSQLLACRYEHKHGKHGDHKEVRMVQSVVECSCAEHPLTHMQHLCGPQRPWALSLACT